MQGRPKRPKPRTRTSDETITALLHAAEATFSTRDFESVSLRDIAKSAGVTVSTIHHYFENKEALFQYSLDRHYERVSALQQELLPTLLASASLDEAIQGTVERTFYFCWEHRNAIAMTMRPVVTKGDVHERRRLHVEFPFFNALSGPLSQRYKTDDVSIRLTIRSAMAILVRYAISSEDSLRALVRHDETVPIADTLSVIARHCGDAVLALLRGLPRKEG